MELTVLYRTINNEYITMYIEPLTGKKYQSECLAPDKHRYFLALLLVQAPLFVEIISNSVSGDTFTIIWP